MSEKMHKYGEDNFPATYKELFAMVKSSSVAALIERHTIQFVDEEWCDFHQIGPTLKVVYHSIVLQKSKQDQQV